MSAVPKPIIVADAGLDRHKGIGASEAPIVMGLSPWRTPFELWLEKTAAGERQPENLAMRIGKALEPVVLRAFTDETGLPVTDQQARYVDPDHPWRWATVDGIAGNALVEAKTTGSSEGWGEPGTDQVPVYYVAQVQHALACTGLRLAYIPVLIAGRDFRVYEVRRDDAIIEAITQAEQSFWNCVQTQVAPPMLAPSEARIRWTQDNGEAIVATPDIELEAAELAKVLGDIKALEAAADDIKARIQTYMTDAATLVSPDGRALATWKTAKASLRFDADQFKTDHPDLYAEYRKPGAPSRRFLLKV